MNRKQTMDQLKKEIVALARDMFCVKNPVSQTILRESARRRKRRLQELQVQNDTKLLYIEQDGKEMDQRQRTLLFVKSHLNSLSDEMLNKIALDMDESLYPVKESASTAEDGVD